MRLEHRPDFETQQEVYTLTLEREDMQRLWPLHDHDMAMLKYFAREEASIEERLMGLQVLARVIESN